MSYNQALTERVRLLLADTSNVSERKMFGSIGFMVKGKLWIGVGDHPDHSMMVRVGPEQYQAALKHPDAFPAIMRGQERPGYIFIKSEGLISEQKLQYWVNLALNYIELL